MKKDNNLRIYGDIPGFSSFLDVEPVNAGISDDLKLRVETAEGTQLLRISDIGHYERKKTMFDMMRRVAELGVAMQKPLEIGLCNGGRSVYQRLSWCGGETAEQVLPKLSESQRYTLGLKAGRNLRLIHSIPAPAGTQDWYDGFVGMNDARVRYDTSACGVPAADCELLLSCYDENRHLLRGRPQSFIHGDYHNENLIISPEAEVSVIDWDLVDSLYGDPWSEFNRIPLTSVFPHFTTGLLRGYFGGEPPEDFWRLLALYLASGALTLISFALFVRPEYSEESRQNAANVLSWFDGMRSMMPSWYLKELS